MKKTARVNISGFVFHIDDDAYRVLDNYISHLQKQFGTDEDGKEIIADVEARIAELLMQRVDHEKEVVTQADVNYIISVLGQPEDYEMPEGYVYDEPEKPGNKRMFRDTETGYLGGVSSGIGAYFGIPALYVRLAFLISLFFAGTGVVLYIILWIIIPEAKTTSQKLQMKGERINLSNIEKSLKNEFSNVQKNFDDLKQSKAADNFRKFTDGFADSSGNAAKSLGRVITFIIGIVFMLISFPLLSALAGFIFFNNTFLSPLNWFGHQLSAYDLGQYFIDGGSAMMFTIALALVIGIPLLSILWAGTKLVFNIKDKKKIVAISGTLLWFAGLAMLSFYGVSQAAEFEDKATVTEEYPLRQFNSDTLILAVNYDDWKQAEEFEEIDIDNYRLAVDGNNAELIGVPRFRIEKSKTNNFVLKVNRYARGKSTKEARGNAEKISSEWQQMDSLLIIEPYFNLGERKWHNQRVSYTLYVPTGATVFLPNSSREIIYDIENIENIWDWEMTNKYWLMTSKGLIESGRASELAGVAIEKKDSVNIDTVTTTKPDATSETDSMLEEMKSELEEE